MKKLIKEILELVPDKFLDIHSRNYTKKKWAASSCWQLGTGDTIEEALKELLNKIKKMKITTKQNNNFIMNIPYGWRIGQTLFNFQEWLLSHGGYANQAGSRCADTFHMSDEDIKEKYAEFLKEFENK